MLASLRSLVPKIWGVEHEARGLEAEAKTGLGPVFGLRESTHSPFCCWQGPSLGDLRKKETHTKKKKQKERKKRGNTRTKKEDAGKKRRLFVDPAPFFFDPAGMVSDGHDFAWIAWIRSLGHGSGTTWSA